MTEQAFVERIRDAARAGGRMSAVMARFSVGLVEDRERLCRLARDVAQQYYGVRE